MPRRLLLRYPGALNHLMAGGNGLQDIVCDDMDRELLQEQLGKAAIRRSWRVYAFAIMAKHLHVVLKTPDPNLSRGMQ
jgi:putative transposase